MTCCAVHLISDANSKLSFPTCHATGTLSPVSFIDVRLAHCKVNKCKCHLTELPLAHWMRFSWRQLASNWSPVQAAIVYLFSSKSTVPARSVSKPVRMYNKTVRCTMASIRATILIFWDGMILGAAPVSCAMSLQCPIHFACILNKLFNATVDHISYDSLYLPLY